MTFPADLIDGCAYHDWRSPLDLLPYMSPGWRATIERRGDIGGPMNIKSMRRYDDLLGRRRADAQGGDASDLDRLVARLEDGGRMVLGYDEGLLATAYPLPYVARQTMRAANDWTREEWLARDERLYGHVLVSMTLPEDSAAEIRRVGSDERMVAVELGMNGLGRAFGHPIYHPVYAAAAELGLPLVLQATSDGSGDTAPPTAFGLPATGAEYEVLCAQGLMNHVASMITSGVFDLFPTLRVLLVGGGAAWVPAWLWRVDASYRTIRRVEVPWLRGSPSEYFARHFRLATYGLESPPQPERLEAVLDAIPSVTLMFVYASGYPNRAGEEPEAVAARLPEAWHDGVFRANAEAFYRWPGGVRPAHGVPVATDEIRERTSAAPPVATRRES